MDTVLGLVRHAGNDALFRAIEMSVLATLSGTPLHLHAEGLRGTGKTTIMRAVKRLLPKIRRIKDCLYHCDPARPHCPRHRHLPPQEVEALGEEWVPMPFLEVSHSARVGTVVGSIDLARLVSPTNPEAALLPGTVPQAHRGIIFVDEVNRLAETAPELADVLLDVMGTKPGRVQIEETGLPAVEFPVQVTVWAASNPDEDPGPLQDIRRQLSDRFDLGIHTKRPGDAAVVARILSLTEQDHRAPPPEGAAAYEALLMRRADALRTARVPEAIRTEIAEIYNRHDIESLRAVQAIQHGIRLLACLEGRAEAAGSDLLQVVEMALYHRVDHDTRAKVMEFLRARHARQGEVAGVQARRQEPAPLPAPEPGKPRWETVAPLVGQDRAIPQGSPACVSEQEARPGFLRRFLSGLRQRAGAKGAPDGTHREQTTDTLRRARREEGLAAYRKATLPPTPGRLFRRIPGTPDAPYEDETSSPGRTSPGDGAGSASRTSPPGGTAPASRTGQPGGEAPASGTGSHGGAGADGDAGADGGTGSHGRVQPVDPTTVAPTAPPHPARRVSRLLPHELLRTEEELGNR